jgi:steroid delta-isomerase-like uncharacterized protein
MNNKSIIVRQFIERVLNGGNLEATGDYFWEDFVEEVPLPGQGPGLSGLKDVLKGMRSAFPDMHWTAEEQVESGDKVVTRFTWSGTHQSTFLGVPATGRRVTVWGMVIDQFIGEKIKSTRIIMDVLGLMAQLGVFPPANNPAKMPNKAPELTRSVTHSIYGLGAPDNRKGVEQSTELSSRRKSAKVFAMQFPSCRM